MRRLTLKAGDAHVEGSGPQARGGALQQLGASVQVEQDAAITNPLVGAWRLLSCELRSADGAVSYPWGPDASAYLIYTEDGHVSYQVAVAN